MNEDQTEVERRLTVSEAAELLGISSEAVRTRIKRGTLASVREGGRVFIVMGPDQTTSDDDQTHVQTNLVDELRNRVAFLEAELKTRTEEARRKDHLLAAALERIPALEPPGDAESPAPGNHDPTTPPEPEMGGERVPWWRRVFGG